MSTYPVIHQSAVKDVPTLPRMEPLPDGYRLVPLTCPSEAKRREVMYDREYHYYRAGAYIYPNDEREKDKLDIYHKMFLVARGGSEIHRAPVNMRPLHGEAPRILDLGTGTGIWAIEMAYKYPQAEVIGMDLSPIQPAALYQAPEKLRFYVADFESEWTLGRNSFDLIHLRVGTGSISNYPQLFRRIHQHLRPGVGWFEYVDIDIVAESDDGSLRPDHAIVQWQEHVLEASARTGKPLRHDHHAIIQYLQSCGFIDIQEHMIKIPLNPWPQSPQAKELGRWYNLGLYEGIEGMTLGPLCKVAGWPIEHVRDLLARVTKEINTKSIHAYHKMFIYTARRPYPSVA